MINEIVKFSGLLRENGIPASIRSTQMACEAAEIIKEQKGNLKEALACIYLKDQRQRMKFNHLYESFFVKKGKEIKKMPSGPGDKSKFLKKYNVSTTRLVSDFNSGKKGQQFKIDYIKNALNDINNDTDREGNSELLKCILKL